MTNFQKILLTLLILTQITNAKNSPENQNIEDLTPSEIRQIRANIEITFKKKSSVKKILKFRIFGLRLTKT